MLCGPLDMPNLTLLGIPSTAEYTALGLVILLWSGVYSHNSEFCFSNISNHGLSGWQLLLLTAIVTAAAAADAVSNNCLDKRMHLCRSSVNTLICRGYAMV